MNRKLLITLHLYFAAFFTPLVLLVAFTGAMYLAGVKGKTETTALATLENRELSVPKDAAAAATYVRELLQQAGVADAKFDYVKGQGSQAITRPTHRQHYQLKQAGANIEINQMNPDWMVSLLELHKGHGPQGFRLLATAFGFALIFIMLSGCWLGLQSPGLKNKTLALTGIGAALAVVLALL